MVSRRIQTVLAVLALALVACRGPAGEPGQDGEDGAPGAQGPMGPASGFSTAIRTRCALGSSSSDAFEHEIYVFPDGSQFVTCSAYGDAYGLVIYPKSDWVGAATSSCSIRVPSQYVVTFNRSGATSTATVTNGSTTTNTPIPCTTTTP